MKGKFFENLCISSFNLDGICLAIEFYVGNDFPSEFWRHSSIIL